MLRNGKHLKEALDIIERESFKWLLQRNSMFEYVEGSQSQHCCMHIFYFIEDKFDLPLTKLLSGSRDPAAQRLTLQY